MIRSGLLDWQYDNKCVLCSDFLKCWNIDGYLSCTKKIVEAESVCS